MDDLRHCSFDLAGAYQQKTVGTSPEGRGKIDSQISNASIIFGF
jgi:hypothetical protein